MVIMIYNNISCEMRILFISLFSTYYYYVNRDYINTRVTTTHDYYFLRQRSMLAYNVFFNSINKFNKKKKIREFFF